MRWSLARLRPVHLVLFTAAYWLGLVVTKLGSAILAAWQVSLLPSGQGTITASLEGARLGLTIAREKSTLWSGSASVGAILLWVVGPPLLLALTRRWAREVEVEVAGDPRPDALGARPEGDPRSLPSPPWPRDQHPESQTTRVVSPRQSQRPSPPSGQGG